MSFGGFDGTTGNICRNSTTPPVTGYPASLSLWYKRAADTSGTLACLGPSDGTVSHGFSAFVTGAGVPQARRQAGGSANNATASAGTDDTGVWHHVLCVFDSATACRVYHDGGNEGTSATSIAPNAFAHAWIGAANDDSARFSGSLGHIACWNKALASGDAAALFSGGAGGNGKNPLTVEAANLKIYWPGTNAASVGQEVIAGYDLTIAGDVVYSADDPPVDAPPASVSIAAIARYYQMLRAA